MMSLSNFIEKIFSSVNSSNIYICLRLLHFNICPRCILRYLNYQNVYAYRDPEQQVLSTIAKFKDEFVKQNPQFEFSAGNRACI